MLNVILLTILIILNAADLATTLKALANGDTEGNRLYRLKPRLGRLIAVKLIMVGLGVGAIWLTAPTAWAFLLPLNLIGCVVIWNNILALKGKDTIF